MLSRALPLGLNALWFGVLEFLVIFISEFVLWVWNPVGQWRTDQEIKSQALLTSPPHFPWVGFQPPPPYSCAPPTTATGCLGAGKLKAQGLGVDGQWYLGAGQGCCPHRVGSTIACSLGTEWGPITCPQSRYWACSQSFLPRRLQPLTGPREVKIDWTSLSPPGPYIFILLWALWIT